MLGYPRNTYRYGRSTTWTWGPWSVRLFLGLALGVNVEPPSGRVQGEHRWRWSVGIGPVIFGYRGEWA